MKYLFFCTSNVFSFVTTKAPFIKIKKDYMELLQEFIVFYFLGEVIDSIRMSLQTIHISDPCEAGSFYSCTTRSCQPCDIGTFQPVWGQTSCWACPPNTTTDTTGSSSPTQCKHTQCVHHSRYEANCQQPGGHSCNRKLHTQ